MSVFSCKAKIRAELRWLSTAAALLDRPDRQEALLNRYVDLPIRMAVVDEQYALFLEKGTDLEEGVRKEVENDVDQCYELSDRIAEIARPLHRGRVVDTDHVKTSAKSMPALWSRLPPLDLRHFSGRLDEWEGFSNLFNSLVDAREDLTAGQKLAYLLTVLEGEAREQVQHLAPTDENYKVAMDIVTRRYQNVRRLADVHVATILALPRVTNVMRLRVEILNPLLVAFNALRSLNLPVDEWSFLLLHIVLAKMPDNLKVRFEQQYGGDSSTYLPPFKDLLKFMEDESRLADNSDVVSPSWVRVKDPQTSLGGRPLRSGRQDPRPFKRYSAVQETSRCEYCKDPGHLMPSCKKFFDQRIQGRRAIARQRGWCYSCLGPHLQRECSRPHPCGYCSGNHHPSLCMNRSSVGTEQSRKNDNRGPEPYTGHVYTGSQAHKTPRTGGGTSLNRRQTKSAGGSVESGRSRGPRSPRMGGGPRSSPPREQWNRPDSYGVAVSNPQVRSSPPFVERPRLERRRYTPEWDPLDRVKRIPPSGEAVRFPTY